MNIVRLTTTKLNIEDISNEIASPDCGAISLFVGTTRDTFEDRKVIRLEYEAHEEMARNTMEKICSQIRSKWDVKNISIHHRLGVVPVKEASIVIAISSPHRTESLLGVQFAIDEIKASVPIWKKEIYEAHDAEWKENKECSWMRC